MESLPASDEELQDTVVDLPVPETRLSQESASNVVDASGDRILFLDDDPARAELFLSRYPQAVWVQTAEQCILRLTEAWSQVHLDHDLGGEHFVDSSRSDCGMEVVRWLCGEFREQLRDTRFIIHSHHVDAAEQMVWSLYDAGYHAAYRPFSVDLVDWLCFHEAKNARESHGSWRKWLVCPGWLNRLAKALRISLPS
jgi:hypothetical protein